MTEASNNLEARMAIFVQDVLSAMGLQLTVAITEKPDCVQVRLDSARVQRSTPYNTFLTVSSAESYRNTTELLLTTKIFEQARTPNCFKQLTS